jgi:hypothetical protein
MTEAEPACWALCILAKNETMENVQHMSQYNEYLCSDVLRVKVNKDLWLYVQEFELHNLPQC